MINLTRKALQCATIALLLTQTQARSEENYFKNYDHLSQEKCEWRLEGCVAVDENELDFRSQAKRMLDDLYACKNTIEGCSEQQQQAINSLNAQKDPMSKIKSSAMSSREFSRLLKKHDPNLEQQKYFIPLGLTDKELVTLAAATSLGLVLFPSDEKVMEFVQDHKSEFTEAIVAPTNNHEKLLMGGLVAGSYFVGAVMKDNKLVSAGLYAITTQLATQMVTDALKVTVKRERPNRGNGAFSFAEGGNSFVSGHSSGAWSLATVFAEIYKDSSWIPYVSYGVAALTSYGRLHAKAHFLTDVFYAGVAGHIITKIVMRMHEGDDTYGGLYVMPSYDAETGSFWIKMQYSPKGKVKKEKWLCTKFPKGSKERIDACIYEAFQRSEASRKGLGRIFN